MALVVSVLGLIRSVLGLIRSCTNVTLFNVINVQFTGHKWRSKYGGGRAGNYVSILNIVTIRNYGLPLEMSGVRDVEYTGIQSCIFLYIGERKFQGGKTPSQSRHMYNKGKK